ncbi:unnamed protein product [Clonostachys byssicola]|uniref:Zinc metalloproteinase n=1 Tax=Clonostachys byssicola TaxID=160290 RepID=A0A9N9U3C3_9HYPO|nr:unnamed protein product [Clonostachys byssicola]
MFKLHNINDNEDIYQRCLLITGQCEGSNRQDTFVQVDTTNESGIETFPSHHWPLCKGWFKCLVLLTPGKNIVKLSTDDGKHTTELSLTHIPLTNAPPLHLAIMVAKDSPLLVDCPPNKLGFIFSAHSDLSAVVAKMRMAACMWQALTAEEMRAAGLGRRAFRLEDEWGSNTLSERGFRSPQSNKAMGSTIKVHIVRTEKTVAELRDANIAQQNEKGRDRDGLHRIFSNALKAHGAPFQSHCRPVVAGLILDSAFDQQQNMILGHAALGAHNPDGLSLGIFGSHLTYSWPRFLEEVPACLLDTTLPGDTVGNDNGECATNWEACAIGQGAFLHEVGHAFSAPHTTGIMARGYSRDWTKCFLSIVAYSEHLKRKDEIPITNQTSHLCHWDLEDMLRFFNLPHFQLPSDTPRSSACPTAILDDDTDPGRLIVRCEAGIASAKLNGDDVETAPISNPTKELALDVNELEQKMKYKKKPLELRILSMNGKHTNFPVWSLLSSRTYIPIHGTGIRLLKKGVSRPETYDNDWPWVVMLKKRNRKGSMSRAYKIDVRVGCALDGAEVYFEDGTKIPCGPRGEHGADPDMGGHQARKIKIPRNVEIAKVLVAHHEGSTLSGLRLVLSNGKAIGALNKNGSNSTITPLVPDDGHKIVGFYGNSGEFGLCSEFGIITAPRDVEIPDSVYDMPELQNLPKNGNERGHRSKKRKVSRSNYDSGTEGNGSSSEDRDEGYDCESDADEF